MPKTELEHQFLALCSFWTRVQAAQKNFRGEARGAHSAKVIAQSAGSDNSLRLALTGMLEIENLNLQL
jgi:hypothetical protein